MILAEWRRDVECAADLHAKEHGGCDADDRERDAVERERAANDIRGATKMPLPEAVADHRDGTLAAACRLVIRIGKQAAHERCYTQGIEERATRPQTVDELRFPA